MPDDDSYRVVFLSQISRFYGHKKACGDDSSEEQDLRVVDLDLKHLYDVYESASGRSIPSNEARKIADTVGMLGVAPEVYAYAIKYSSDNGHTDIRYINKVAINWHNEGCNTEADAKALLDRMIHSHILAHPYSVFYLGFDAAARRTNRTNSSNFF